ncbi:hypothetical protein Vafri_1978 [Volvox africanus]|nr:hypothetical protein Vafri_1978 [Volvox africanus]
MDSSRTSTQHHPPSPGLAGKMVQNARNTHAPSTWRQYDPAIRGFVAYCARHRLPPPGTGAHGRRLLSKKADDPGQDHKAVLLQPNIRKPPALPDRQDFVTSRRCASPPPARPHRKSGPGYGKGERRRRAKIAGPR